MITYSIILREDRTNKKSEHPLYLQFIYNRKKKVLALGEWSKKEHWNSNKELPEKKHPAYYQLKGLIEKRKSEISNNIR